ncbi:extracellular solute-binding protein [Endozoicomonas sp. SCSIO W0465]|uniref:extracellular solute-binding protein n=1 Tax=Endozoicomonas sp. SCSIO W0465 TaxID=2918516 RepID=UPI0020754092|nr:extracellular solute-binding protein [Endozoicomonas sp. SCSIO W0465]USE36690.1 extracellular solute-binding protein [Endozoicomonas sp. SCSIO W0465]
MKQISLMYLAGLVSVVSIPVLAATTLITHTSHGLSRFDDLKYPEGFKHFDYVNPDAPKRGKLNIAAIGILDTLNPYSQTGTHISQISPLRFFTLGFLGLNEPLMVGSGTYSPSGDEARSAYGLIAESVEYPDDNQWITFNLHPNARFHDGQSVTAEDVEFSFEHLRTKGPIKYQIQLKPIARVEVLGKHRVRFHFKSSGNRDQLFCAAELPVLPAHYWRDELNEKSKLTPPLGSGPYKITHVEGGSSVTFTRVEDYWGKDLPVNQGKYNFNQITLYFYRDLRIAFEAFKAGALSLYFEPIAKNWANGYNYPDIASGKVIKTEIPTKRIIGSPMIVFNTRRAPFNDIRVREAVGYLLDFEWSNRTLFENAYTRANSYFPNSLYAASGVPSSDEQALLEAFRQQLPKALFYQPFSPPKTRGDGSIRAQQHQALTLLKEAGWQLKGGRLVNCKLEPLTFELITSSHLGDRLILPFKKNLASIGIELKYRVIDSSNYFQRVRMLDFDTIGNAYPLGLSLGSELFRYFHSSNADMPDTQNLAGIKHPAIDALLEKIPSAESQQALETIIHSLDRVLLWHHYGIPLWYFGKVRVAHRSNIKRPGVITDYPMIINTWWLAE